MRKVPSGTGRMSIPIRDIAIFSMLGALMYVSKLLMEWAPNIHFIGMLTITYTLVFRERALIPIYLFVFLTGLFGGFATWWIPYLYIWTLLWGAVMLLPRGIPRKWLAVICTLLCGLHGILFGTLYAPVQALLYGFSFEQTLSWIALGFPYDLLHGCGNLAAGTLILPLSELIRRLYAVGKQKTA